MTIKEILGYNADDLEKMSDDELRELLEPMIKNCRFPVTPKEPSYVSLKASPSRPRKPSAKQQLAQQLADLNDLSTLGEI